MGFSVRHTHTTRVATNHTVIMLTNSSFRFPSPSVTSVIKQFFLIFCISKDLGNNAKEWFGKRCSSKGHTTGQRNVIKNRAELTTSWHARPALLARFHGILDCELPVSPIEVLPGLLGRALEGLGIEECFFLSTIFFRGHVCELEIFSIFKMLQDSLFFCRGSRNNMISVLMIAIIMIIIMIRKKESASY